MNWSHLQVKWSHGLSLILLSCVLFWALLHGGAIYPSQRSVTLIGVAVAGCFALIPTSTERLRSFSRLVNVLFYSLFSLAALPLVPIPLSLIQALSPHRYLHLQQARMILGGGGWACLSTFPLTSLLELATVTSALIVFLSIRRIVGSFDQHRWLVVAPLLAAGLFEAYLGIRQANDQSGPATALGTFLNRNHFAGFLEMVFPFLIFAAWICVTSARLRIEVKVVLAIALALAAALEIDAILHTYSRMGWFVSLANLLFTAVLIVVRYQRNTIRTLWIVGLLLVAVLFVGTRFAPERLKSRLENTDSIDRESTGLRLGIWKDCLRMAGDYALTGSGLGTFDRIYPQYQTVGRRYRVEYAHNDFLQALVELGTPAFITGILLLGLLLFRLSQNIANFSDAAAAWLSTASLIAISGMLLHSLVDFNLHIPVNLLTSAWIFGLGLPAAVNGESYKDRREKA